VEGIETDGGDEQGEGEGREGGEEGGVGIGRGEEGSRAPEVDWRKGGLGGEDGDDREGEVQEGTDVTSLDEHFPTNFLHLLRLKYFLISLTYHSDVP
jgi:hypothetical protein